MKRMIAVILLVTVLFSSFGMLLFSGCSGDDEDRTCDACGQVGRRHVIVLHGRTFHICSDCVRKVRAGEDIGL